MIAKIITRGATRTEAIAVMSRALQEFSIDGIKTTVPLALALMADARFARGDTNTAYLENFMKDSFLINNPAP
jgi:acetyl-CoA carboxylase biotin carboxylase subunit